MLYVDIGVFAHNEENSIELLIDDLARQSLIVRSDVELRIRILCNGCCDNTVSVSQHAVGTRELIRQVTVVDDFMDPGKSRTWNRFVNGIPDDSQITIFIDGDIRIKDHDALMNLVEDLLDSDAVAITSCPLKDMRKLNRNPSLRVAASLVGRTHQDGSISGQLYAVKTAILRRIHLPVPCLVEDGFLAACLITGLFSHQGRPELVKASRRASHYFETPGSLREFFHHDVRLALGCELNAALYSDLWAAHSTEERVELLRKFAKSVGIEHSLYEHQMHPEKSALNYKSLLSKLRGRDTESILSRLLRLPFRLLHYLYMLAVFRRARRLFAERQFQW